MGKNPEKTPFAAPLDIRFVGVLAGRYSLSGGNAAGSTVFACRMQSLTSATVTLAAPVIGEPGQRTTVLLDQIGFIAGHVARVFEDGFQLDIQGSNQDRQKLAAKINWLKKRNLRQAADKRSTRRFLPRNPRAFLYLGSEEHNCFLIDISPSGAGVSSAVSPPIGTSIVLGKIPGRVVRQMNVGFGIAFDVVATAETLESDIGERRQRP